MLPSHPYRQPADLSRFYVITPISNPRRFARRYELYFVFKEMCTAAGINLITIEQAFGDRPYAVTTPTDPMNLQVRTVEELWHKENMINIAAAHAAKLGAREIAWVDADVRSLGDDRSWFENTWHALQHYEFVQMFESLIDLDLQNRPIIPGTHGTPSTGFIANYITAGTPNPEEVIKIDATAKSCRSVVDSSGYDRSRGAKGQTQYVKSVLYGHPGGAWAASMDAFNKVGGLIDYSILGAGDHYMAYALIGSLSVLAKEGWAESISSPVHTSMLYAWQESAEHWIKRDVGFVPGTISHDFHGPKSKRGYGTRWKILTQNAFDPVTDLKKDSQGLYQLNVISPRQIKMRDQIRAYFASRQEDSTEDGYTT